MFLFDWKRSYGVLLLCVMGCGEPAAEVVRQDAGVKRFETPREGHVVPELKVFDVLRPEVPEATPNNRRAVAMGPQQVASEQGASKPVSVSQYDGERRPAFVNSDGHLAVPAMTCSNPQCVGEGEDGGPLLVYYRSPDIQFRGDGTMYRTGVEPPAARCPECGEISLVEYVLPETFQRRSELLAELKSARTARRQGKGDSVRTPTEIMNELSSLSRVYLTAPP